MDISEVIHYSSQSLWLVLILSMPPILAAAVIGTLVSLIQALTQVQEQTLGFVVKLIAIIIALFASAGWMGTELYAFSELMFDKISVL